MHDYLVRLKDKQKHRRFSLAGSLRVYPKA